MPLWSAPLAVKAALRGEGAEKETRRVVLPAGATTRLEDFLALLRGRFGKPIARSVAYIDEEGERITLSTDAEWKEALALGVTSFEVAPAAAGSASAPPAGGGGGEEWEVVGGAEPRAAAAVLASGGYPAAVAAVPPGGRGEEPWSDRLQFWLNGEEVVVENPSPHARLLDWLRDVRGLTGTHVGCGEGGCGICTVALSRVDPETKRVDLVPINSCLRRLCAVDGCHVVTTEGLGCKSSGYHAVQTAIAAGNGSQCGFCTPGWVMNMYALLEKNKTPSAEEVEQHFDGNLCRCTGYRPILTSFGAFARGGKRCGHHQAVNHPTAMLAYAPKPLHFTDAATGQEWYRPVSMEQYMAAAAGAGAGRALRPVCASTADGLEKYYGGAGAAGGTVFVDTSLLPELHGARLDADGLCCGAAVPIARVIELLEQGSPDVPAFGVLARHMKRVASTQIRSVASWAGNLMFTREHPGFPSDLATILAAAGATFDVLGADAKMQTCTVPQLLRTKGRVLVLSMLIPRLPAGTVFETFKVSQRHVFAHAIVNFGACIEFDARNGRAVKCARIFLGGASEALLDASGAAAVLVGRQLDNAAFQAALAALRKDIMKGASPNPRNSPEYRQRLAASFLYKTFLSASSTLPPQLKSAIVPFVPAEARPVSGGTESFGTDPSEGPVSQYVTKRSAFIQASGEALYPSDYSGPGALFGQVVLSTSAHARLVSLDPTPALRMPGVRDFVAASAVPGLNCPNGSIGGDNLKEKVFFEVNDEIPCVGVILGLIVADTWRQAHDAAKAVVQRYAALGPVVAGIEEAVQLRAVVTGLPADTAEPPSAYGRRGARPEHAAGLERGAPRRPLEAHGLRSAKGSFKTGGQSHFYMETQSVCVIPHDGDQWEVICSDQDSNGTQANVALVLGIPQHSVNVKVPRAGGGFGGKLTRQCLTACAAAVAAKKLRRPVRIQNERLDDMRLVGGREAIQFDYEVSFDGQGKVDSMDVTMTLDPGWFYGDAKGDMSMAVGWADNCYHYKHFKVHSQAALTHKPHTTSMRAPGCMQSILAAEVAIEHVARSVGKPVEEVQALNFYDVSESPVTPAGDHIGKAGYNWTIPTLWPQIQKQARFSERQKVVDAYNAANRWTKKGIAISPVKYIMDIGFYSSGALICIYADGTVLVSTGGSELGQGLNTKVALCVADALGAPLEKVVVGPRETSKIPDNTATGGSGTSECSSEAAILACQKLVPLLEPYRAKSKTWDDAVAAACDDKVGLVATGWYTFKKTTNQNSYATYGTAVSEATIDVLTGEVQIDRVDILMDLGTQLDAAIDIGQLQGGFVIAMGHLLTEELKVDPSGTQLNIGTWEYKIPTAYDIPLEFNVSLLKDSPNPVGIKGSKASAEPAMCLIPSVYLAVKNAIYAARAEILGSQGWFMLDTPLTPEAIRAAVGVTDAQLLVP